LHISIEKSQATRTELSFSKDFAATSVANPEAQPTSRIVELGLDTFAKVKHVILPYR